MHQQKYHCLPDSQEKEQDAQVCPEVQHHEGHFNGVIVLLLEDQEAKTGSLQAERNQRQHGKKEEGLMFDDQLLELSLLEEIFPVHREDRHREVRIEALLVGVAVVSIMLVHPPPIAHPNEQVARQKPNEIVFPGLAKDLPVSSIVDLLVDQAIATTSGQGPERLRGLLPALRELEEVISAAMPLNRSLL